MSLVGLFIGFVSISLVVLFVFIFARKRSQPGRAFDASHDFAFNSFQRENGWKVTREAPVLLRASLRAWRMP